jgi:ankyrin repeat protein
VTCAHVCVSSSPLAPCCSSYSLLSSLIDCACAGSARSDDLQFLVVKGVDLDDMQDDRTPLMAAAQYGVQEGVEALVRAGADVDLQNSMGVTALMIAVTYGHTNVVSFLLDHSGAKPELLDATGVSALQRAFEKGHTSIASKLVKALAAPPARVTTVAKEKMVEARKKAAEAESQAEKDRKALLEKTLREVKEEEEEEKATRN